MSTNIQAFNYERLQLIMQFKRQMSDRDIKMLSENEEGKILYVLQNEDRSAEEDVDERIRIKIDRLEKEIKRGIEEQSRNTQEGHSEFKNLLKEEIKSLFEMVSKELKEELKRTKEEIKNDLREDLKKNNIEKNFPENSINVRKETDIK